MAAVEQANSAAKARLKTAALLPMAHAGLAFDSSSSRVWPTKRLGDIAQVAGGIQKTPERAPVQHHRPYLTVRNVQRGYLDLSHVERFEVAGDELARLRLFPGDILIVEGNGSLEQIGRNALFTECEEDEWIHQNHIIRVRLSTEVCLPEFVSAFLNSSHGVSQLIAKAKSTSGLYTLTSGKIASLEIPTPPRAEQERVSRLLDEQLAMVGRLRRRLEEEVAAIAHLPSALLRRAFSEGGA